MALIGSLMALLVAVVAAGCEAEPQAQRATDPEDEELRRRVRALEQAELIFVGTVMDVGKPPPAWAVESGYLMETQPVRYRILEVLRGDRPVPRFVERELRAHLCDAGLEVVEEAADRRGKPRLVLGDQVVPEHAPDLAS